MNCRQILESIRREATELDSPSRHAEHIAAADTDDEAKKRIAKVPTKHLQSAHHWNLGYSGGEHKYNKHVKSELQKRGALLSPAESSKRFDEDVHFQGANGGNKTKVAHKSIAENAPVAPVPDKKYIKGTPEHKALKALRKPINGMPTNKMKEEAEEIDELSKTTLGDYVKAASRDSSVSRKMATDFEHRSKRAKNKGMKAASASLADKFKNDARKRQDNVDKAVDRLSKEETMPKSFKGFLVSLVELTDKQRQLDKNKNGKLDSHDFKLLRKEDELDEKEGTGASDPLANRQDYAKRHGTGQVYKKTHAGDKTGMSQAYAYDIKRSGPKGKLPEGSKRLPDIRQFDKTVLDKQFGGSIVKMAQALKDAGFSHERIVQKMNDFKQGVKEEVENLDEVSKSEVDHHYDKWTSSSDAPNHHDAGDDNKIHNSALKYLRSTNVPKENHKKLAMHIANKFHGSGIDEAAKLLNSLDEANHRELASAGKMHPMMAKHMTKGHEMDFYAQGSGDKTTGVVKHNDGKEVHIAANKNDKRGAGAMHKFKISGVLESKEVLPFEPDTKLDLKKPKNPNRTGMDTARALARKAMQQKMKEEYNIEITEEQAADLCDTASLDEKMDMAKADMGDVIKDFKKSDAPQFAGKSDEKRREMAIAAKLQADRGGKKSYREFVELLAPQIQEGSEDEQEVTENAFDYKNIKGQTSSGKYDVKQDGNRTVVTRKYNPETGHSTGTDDEEKPASEKRGRGRPAGAKSGAKQQGSEKKSDYRGIDRTTHALHLPNRK